MKYRNTYGLTLGEINKMAEKINTIEPWKDDAQRIVPIFFKPILESNHIPMPIGDFPIEERWENFDQIVEDFEQIAKDEGEKFRSEDLDLYKAAVLLMKNAGVGYAFSAAMGGLTGELRWIRGFKEKAKDCVQNGVQGRGYSFPKCTAYTYNGESYRRRSSFALAQR